MGYYHRLAERRPSPLLFSALVSPFYLLWKTCLPAGNGGDGRRLKKQWTCCYQSWKAWSYCNALFEVKHGCVSCDKCTSKRSGCLAARAVSPVMAFGPACSVPADIIYLWQLRLCSPQHDYQCSARGSLHGCMLKIKGTHRTLNENFSASKKPPMNFNFRLLTCTVNFKYSFSISTMWHSSSSAGEDFN